MADPTPEQLAEHRRFVVECDCTHDDAATMLGFEGRGDLFPKVGAGGRPTTLAGREARRAAGRVTRSECEKYIELVGEGASKSEAAKALGKAPGALTRACNADPDLKAGLEEAWFIGAEPIIEELTRMCVDGWEQEVYQGGKFVGMKRMKDSTAGIFAVKGRRPEYKDKTAADATVQVQVNFDDRSAQLEEMARVLREARANIVEGSVIAEVEDGGGVAVGELPAAQGVLAEPSDV